MFDALTLGLWKKMLGDSIDGLFNPRGDYNPDADPPYSKHDVVFDNGSSFRYINNTPSNEPTSSTSHWQQIAAMGGQDLVDAAVAARDAAQGYKDAAANSAAQLAENETIINQSDFVELAKSMISYKGAKFRKYSPDLYEVALYNKNRHMTYRFIKDTNDDFIKLSEVFDGDFSIGFIDKENAVDKFGTWAVDTGTNQYTVTPGAGFKCNVKGSRLIFSAYTESRGGLWEFTIDDSLKKEVSVYSESPVSLVEFIIADGLEIDKDHKVVAVFKGDDPFNQPSSTPSRGYATHMEITYNGTIKGVDPYRTNNKLNIISAATSNKEWAMSIEYAGQYYGFIPDHGIGYAFNVSPPKFLIDGEEFDAPNSDVVIWKELTDFKLVQEIQIIVNSVAVAKVLLTHKLDKSGVVKYSGALISLENYKILTLYPLMLPMNQDILTEAITSTGKQKVSDGSESEYVFENAEDEILSACGVSETNRDFIIAGKITNPFKTMRIGKTAGKPTEKSLFFWQRASYPKIYWRSIADLLMVTGDVYSWSGEIICAKIPNIYNYVK